MPLYRFREMTADDLPLLQGWLAAPHVTEWWGDPDEQFGLVSGDLAEPAMQQFIVAADDAPFAPMKRPDSSATSSSTRPTASRS